MIRINNKRLWLLGHSILR